jgi:hypothetical protein
MVPKMKSPRRTIVRTRLERWRLSVGSILACQIWTTRRSEKSHGLDVYTSFIRRNQVGNTLDALFHCSRRLRGEKACVTTRYTPSCKVLMGGPAYSVLSVGPFLLATVISGWAKIRIRELSYSTDWRQSNSALRVESS